MRTLSSATRAAPTRRVHPALTRTGLGSLRFFRERTVRTTMLAILALLAACSRGEPQTAPTRAFSREGVTFELRPQSADDCKARGEAYRGTVRWQVPAADKIDLELRLKTPDGQVFLGTNKVAGEQETGDWVQPGLWFLLLDRRKDETVAAFQAGPSPCR